VELCKDMQEQKVFSKKWIYENIFGLSDHDMITLQKQLIDDAKGNYRFKQIEEEGNDPALSFLNKKDKESESGGGGDGNEPGGSEPGADAAPEGGDTSGKDTGAEAGGDPGTPPKLSEKRDQTGRKDASKYPFGEDPLGTLENNRRSDLSVSHKYKNKSPLSLESIKGLTDLLKTLDQEKESLREGNEKSFMDEQNIKE
jgi:hypothetical protein